MKKAADTKKKSVATKIAEKKPVAAEKKSAPAVTAKASAAPAKAPAAAAPVKANKKAPTREEIRVRAYHIFISRGASHGRDFDDWLEAERQLMRG